MSNYDHDGGFGGSQRAQMRESVGAAPSQGPTPEAEGWRSLSVCAVAAENASVAEYICQLERQRDALRAELRAATLAANDERTNNTMTLPEVITAWSSGGTAGWSRPPELQMALGGHSVGVFKDENADLREQLAEARRKALELAAVTAWSAGMDAHNKELGLPADAREVGSSCARAIRALIDQPADQPKGEPK